MMMDIHSMNLKTKLVLLEQKQTQLQNLMKDLLHSQSLKRQSRVMALQSLVFTIREMFMKLNSILIALQDLDGGALGNLLKNMRI